MQAGEAPAASEVLYEALCYWYQLIKRAGPEDGERKMERKAETTRDTAAGEGKGKQESKNMAGKE